MSEIARTHVSFVTGLFNTSEVKDYFINPCCFGDDCAQWLIDRLVPQNVGKVDEQPTQEDWGWLFAITMGKRSFMIGIGLCEDEDPPNTWLVFIKSQLGWLSKNLFGDTDNAELLVVCEAVDHALKSSNEISDIRWHSEIDWMKGANVAWRSEPDIETPRG
jgi:hypothetical protein